MNWATSWHEVDLTPLQLAGEMQEPFRPRNGGLAGEEAVSFPSLWCSYIHKQHRVAPVKPTGGKKTGVHASSREFSEWGDIHGRRRTQLNPERADKMVYLYHNNRVRSKVADVMYEKKEAMDTAEWYQSMIDTQGFENEDLLTDDEEEGG